MRRHKISGHKPQKQLDMGFPPIKSQSPTSHHQENIANFQAVVESGGNSEKVALVWGKFLMDVMNSNISDGLLKRPAGRLSGDTERIKTVVGFFIAQMQCSLSDVRNWRVFEL